MKAAYARVPADGPESGSLCPGRGVSRIRRAGRRPRRPVAREGLFQAMAAVGKGDVPRAGSQTPRTPL